MAAIDSSAVMRHGRPASCAEVSVRPTGLPRIERGDRLERPCRRGGEDDRAPAELGLLRRPEADRRERGDGARAAAGPQDERDPAAQGAARDVRAGSTPSSSSSSSMTSA